MAGLHWTTKLLRFNSSSSPANLNNCTNINYLIKVSKNLRNFSSLQLEHKCNKQQQTINCGTLLLCRQYERYSLRSSNSSNSQWKKSFSTTITLNESVTNTTKDTATQNNNDLESSSSNTEQEEQPYEISDECEEFTLWLSDEDISTLTGGDEHVLKQIRYLQLEHEVLRQEGFMVPTEAISLRRWDELLKLTSKGSRKKYYEYLFKTQMARENDKRKKEDKRVKRDEIRAAQPPMPPLGEDPDGMIYGLNRNTLFLRTRDTTINSFYHNRLIHEMQFGQPLVIDCGYDSHMTFREAKNCAKQLEYIFAENRDHPYPYNIHFCSANRNDKVIQQLEIMIPRIFDSDWPINITEKSHLDVFPKERLVYLTPHTRDEIKEIDPDDIYIIGAMVDKSDPRPFSLAKAKKEGLRMAKLPLERYLDWGLGGKCLTLNQIMCIMLDARYHKDWQVALKHVPRRKLKNWGYPTEEGGPDGYNKTDFRGEGSNNDNSSSDRNNNYYQRQPEFERSGFRKNLVNAPSHVSRNIGINRGGENNNYRRNNNYNNNNYNNTGRNQNEYSNNYNEDRRNNYNEDRRNNYNEERRNKHYDSNNQNRNPVRNVRSILHDD